MRKRVSEAGGSGLSAAFTHPDPIDPNDELRQRTQARSDNYPYDMPVSYGHGLSVDDGGAAYQDGFENEPPVPRRKRPEDDVPKDVWEMLESALDVYEPGPQADDAARLGYGNHGRMGDGLNPAELDMDALRNDFRTSFLDTLPRAQSLGRKGLFALLVDLDPEYSAELFAPDDDSEMADTYSAWGRHVYAPGAEFDSGTEYEEDPE